MLAIGALAEYRLNFSRKLHSLKTRDRPLIVPEGVEPPNSKAFDARDLRKTGRRTDGYPTRTRATLN
ncbi:hypothetical protein [Microcoleus sp. AR_TQ3_B6]|uniref:hypothetical protein n=1 Tax=Microcoleus sp. AR_TQ3_B6 TaxID=3055284 RepID=UPI002FD12655